jgi:pimeloyl-ACP methyl ester carboxylesterase
LPFLLRPDGAAIYYEVEGEGPVVLLVHGGTGKGSFDWEFQRPWLVERYRVVTMDLRAHGRSTDPAGMLSMYAVGEDALALIEELGGRVGAVIGFSAGATGLLMCLARDPAAASALGGFVAVSPSIVGATEQRLREIAAGGWPEEIVELKHEAWPDPDHWIALRTAISGSWSRTTRLTAAELAEISCPILTISGAKDRVEAPETSLTLARWAKSGRAVIIPDAGHLVMRHQPEAFRAVVEPFLNEVAA